MADRKLFVVVIRTPNSDRYQPIKTLLENDKRFELEYLDASMTPTYLDVASRHIAYSTEMFEFFHGRKLAPAEIGCADSHNRARKLIQNREDGGIILEDDARITNVDSLFNMAINFLSSEKLNYSILSLTGFRQVGLKNSSEHLLEINKYIKLWGNPDLAVSYVLTNKSADELLKSNQPVKDVSDWPITKCKFFVPIVPLVQHGESNNNSLIDSTVSNFRNNESFLKKVIKLMFIKYLIKRPKGLTIFHYIGIVYGKKIKWRYDYIRVKSQLEYMK
jgi:GR25 family glycosyltransferase involved in LPS biosynthesis